MEIPLLEGLNIKASYTNYKGETKIRLLQINGHVFWGSNQWHKEPQWLVEAYDLEKQEVRFFALKDLQPLGLFEE